MNLIRSILIIISISLGLARSAVASEASGHLFRVQDMDGQQHDFQTILDNGQSIALDYWQTWCAACRREAPQLAKAAEQCKGSIQFFGVVSGTDEFVDDEKVRDFVERAELNYPQIRDRDLTLTAAFQVKGTPTIVVIGEGGSILYRGHHTPDDWSRFQERTSMRKLDPVRLQKEQG